MIDKHKAMTPMSSEESIEILETMPERILPSRFRQRKKPVDQVDAKENPEFAFPLNNDNNDGSKRWSTAKCLWTIVGFHGPDMFGTANQEPGTTASNDQRLRRCVRRVAQDWPR